MPAIVIVVLSVISVLIAGILALVIFLAKIEPGKRESRSEWRGKMGEEYIHEVLAKSTAGTDAKLISDYMFQGQDLTVQIDHIVINLNGVYVIETKNWSGSIYGNEEAKEWTQFLANGKMVHKFRNPIKQNNGHIYQLSRILPHGTPFYNIVVMVQGNTYNIRAKEVVSPSELGSIINSTEDSTKGLTSAQIEKIYDILLKRELKEERSNERHVSEIKNMLTDVNNNICPRCKGNLVIRDGKYGKFYGCSNYPKCTFKKNLE